ncbi:MAG: PEP-CTERM sorting domain-containing protein [Luteolibacter sp.]
MKKLISFSTSTLLAATLVSALALYSDAATVVWGGGDGQYTTGGNWGGGSVPNTSGGDTAEINSGNVTYTPGGDLPVHNGGALVINGGSWTQVGGVAWIQLAGGNLNVAGGTFNQGTAGNIVRDAATTINISAGIANFSGNFLNETAGGIFSITGGTANVANEFKPINTFSMTTGTLSANLISFADGPGGIDFSGGTISVNGAGGNSGFYGGGGAKSLNFTTGSTGSLFFSSYTIADLTADNFLNNGTIQLNGAVSAGSFSAVESGGGVVVTVVPEPSPSLLLLGGIGTFLLIRRRHLG